MNEITILRMNILGGMNEYVLNHVEDEDLIVNDWFANGVPDGGDEDDLRSMAEDEELWLCAVRSFARCIGVE